MTPISYRARDAKGAVIRPLPKVGKAIRLPVSSGRTHGFYNGGRMMDIRQKVALANPCRLAFECADPQFAWRIPKTPASLVLTVNTGYE